MYSTPPANSEDLKERISYEVNLLKENPDSVKRVMAAMWTKIELCWVRNGCHAMAAMSVDSKGLRLNICFYKIHFNDVIKNKLY